MEKCCQGLFPNCVCNFCDICEEKVNGDLYGFDVILSTGDEVTIQGCRECIRKLHEEMTGEGFPAIEEFEVIEDEA